MRAQINQFRRRSARYLGQKPMPVKHEGGIFSLSFDDFPKSAWEVAGPILKEHGITATYYVSGGMCDGSNLDKVQYSERDLCELFEAGHEVGCHTYSHKSVLDLSAADLTKELTKNALWVSERLDGHRMDQFAYPYGDVSVAAKRVTSQHFIHSRSVRDGINTGTADRYNLKAIGLEGRRLPHYDLPKLMADTVSSDGWLIAYGHDVEDQPTPYGCTPRDLENIILMARQAGLKILPVGAAAKLVA